MYKYVYEYRDLLGYALIVLLLSTVSDKLPVVPNMICSLYTMVCIWIFFL
jgi:hypothetical protein